jgi:phenylacetate-CoA ligase
MCEIIGTSFHNKIMPLIRYCTGDRARVEHTAQGPVIHEIAGRDYEFLVSKIGRRISLTALNMHDEIFDGLMAVQFYQERLGTVELRYQPGPQWHSSREDSIRAGLHRKLGDDFSLELRSCTELEKTRSGKHKWLISYLSKSAESKISR